MPLTPLRSVAELLAWVFFTILKRRALSRRRSLLLEASWQLLRQWIHERAAVERRRSLNRGRPLPAPELPQTLNEFPAWFRDSEGDTLSGPSPQNESPRQAPPTGPSFKATPGSASSDDPYQYYHGLSWRATPEPPYPLSWRVLSRSERQSWICGRPGCVERWSTEGYLETAVETD